MSASCRAGVSAANRGARPAPRATRTKRASLRQSWRSVAAWRQLRSAQRLQVRKDVVHLIVRVLAELRGMRVERVVDGDFHLAGRPGARPAGLIDDGDREFVAEGE